MGIYLRTPPLLFMDMSKLVQIRLRCKIVIRGGSKRNMAGESHRFSRNYFRFGPSPGMMLWNCNKMEKRRSSERRSVRLLIYCLGFAARLECDLKPLGLFILIRMRQRWESGRGSCPPLNIIDAWNNIAW